ncbi:ABC transporter ATP-binding protein [Ammoniphilus sp. 3BR4]|uniref:ABC transporter ATP-binding protein n=1 Tax=Ammoniphilus sp. 3BR4 TaxID=3158265 RepID=UPI003465F109
MQVEIKDVSKFYHLGNGERLQALNHVSLKIPEGEFLCLLGPSGCGKSTLLRLLAGIEPYDTGVIQCNNQVVGKPDPNRGFVFQDYALFPWLTVRQNIQFGLENRKVAKKEQKAISDHYLQIMKLADVADAYPSQISGGMKQKVAIARALCLRPSLLLMDEPFGALDAITRMKLQEDLIGIWQQEKVTIVFVTHDVEEAIYLGSRVAVMGSRPAEIRGIMDISLPRPRNRTTPEFGRLREKALDILGYQTPATKINVS